MKNYFSSFFHVSDNSEQLSKNSKNFQKKNFENFVKFFSFIIEKNEEKKFSSFFHVSDDSEQLLKNFQNKFFWGGGIKVRKKLELFGQDPDPQFYPDPGRSKTC